MSNDHDAHFRKFKAVSLDGNALKKREQDRAADKARYEKLCQKLSEYGGDFGDGYSEKITAWPTNAMYTGVVEQKVCRQIGEKSICVKEVIGYVTEEYSALIDKANLVRAGLHVDLEKVVEEELKREAEALERERSELYPSVYEYVADRIHNELYEGGAVERADAQAMAAQRAVAELVNMLHERGLLTDENVIDFCKRLQ